MSRRPAQMQLKAAHPGRRSAHPTEPYAAGSDRRLYVVGGALLAGAIAIVVATFALLTAEPEPAAVRVHGPVSQPLLDGRRPPPEPAPIGPDAPSREEPEEDLQPVGPAVPAIDLGRFEVEHAQRLARGDLAEAASELAFARDELRDSVSALRLEDMLAALRKRAGAELQAAVTAIDGMVAAGDHERAAEAVAAARARLAIALGDSAPFAALDQRVATARAAALARRGLAARIDEAAAREAARDYAGAMRAWDGVASSPNVPPEARTRATVELARLEIEAIVAGVALTDGERARLAPELPALADAARRWLESGANGARDEILRRRPSPALLEALLERARRYEPHPGGVVELELTYEKFADKVFVVLPADYDPRTAYPMIVYLHGTAATVPMCRQQAEFMLGAGRGRYIALVPHTQPPQTGVGWGPTRHGIDPVFAAIDAAMRRFHVDADRVSLTGHSMGGHATWDIGMQYPDRFCALGPNAGAAYHKWQHGMFANLRSVPVTALHGARDGIVPVQLARDSATAAKSAGVDMTYREFEKHGHEAASWDEIAKTYEWLATRRRVRHPPALRYRVRYPHRTRGYWIAIDRFDPKVKSGFVRFVANETRELMERAETFTDPEPPGIEATVTDRSRIDVVPLGVEAVTLHLHPALVEFGQEVTVTCRGKVLRKIEPRADLSGMLDAAREAPWRPVTWMKVSVPLK